MKHMLAFFVLLQSFAAFSQCREAVNFDTFIATAWYETQVGGELDAVFVPSNEISCGSTAAGSAPPVTNGGCAVNGWCPSACYNTSGVLPDAEAVRVYAYLSGNGLTVTSLPPWTTLTTNEEPHDPDFGCQCSTHYAITWETLDTTIVQEVKNCMEGNGACPTLRPGRILSGQNCTEEWCTTTHPIYGNACGNSAACDAPWTDNLCVEGFSGVFFNARIIPNQIWRLWDTHGPIFPYQPPSREEQEVSP